MEFFYWVRQALPEELFDMIGSGVIYFNAEGYVSDDVLHLLEGVAPNKRVLHCPGCHEIGVLPHLE